MDLFRDGQWNVHCSEIFTFKKIHLWKTFSIVFTAYQRWTFHRFGFKVKFHCSERFIFHLTFFTAVKLSSFLLNICSTAVKSSSFIIFHLNIVSSQWKFHLSSQFCFITVKHSSFILLCFIAVKVHLSFHFCFIAVNKSSLFGNSSQWTNHRHGNLFTVLSYWRRSERFIAFIFFCRLQWIIHRQNFFTFVNCVFTAVNVSLPISELHTSSS